MSAFQPVGIKGYRLSLEGEVNGCPLAVVGQFDCGRP
jgi:hypothetical protein